MVIVDGGQKPYLRCFVAVAIGNNAAS